MSARTCPDWPELLELAPDLQFKHYTVAEARLPTEALMLLEGVLVTEAEICCDLAQHVFNAQHTDPAVGAALRETHWYELGEWSTTGPGAGA
jgi:hypothetical protein